MPAPELPVTYADVESAAERLEGIVHRTPVLSSRTVDGIVGATVLFKCENFQRMGAFKIRGAYHAMSRLDETERRRGVLTYSSGNHAQAVALAGSILGIPTTIVMPEDAPEVKIDATRGYGGEIVFYDRAASHREEVAGELARQRDLVLIPPFDHPWIVAGQGTAGREFLLDAEGLDLLLVPCGGGGLLSGCAVAASAMAPGCRVVGVEPSAGDDGVRSFRSGTLERVEDPDTVADGARTPSLGEVTFPLILELVDDMVAVDDDAILRAMFLLWERMKIVVEPTGALAAAALLEGIVDAGGGRVGVVVSGGNVDLGRVGELRKRVSG